ncbi:AAA domain-containing protein [Dyadobacter sp. Leaf189]|uniref:AAA domain-containing protein n=1 Tax=Dyadobacter sp. Leaf189 TaxID=1736295 RepID=UPI0006FE6EF7|nr:AAA domain-containing protein [Dyadobacter sp. Leaf189]KQS33271.1 DNA helicase I [Dyadobacter sp. Leaf189]
MKRILKAYLKRLTNLSTRNKSLLLTHLAAEQFIDLHDTDFVLEKPSIDLVRQLVQQKARIAVCDVADPRYEKVNQISKRLRKISRTEQFIAEERGSQDLFVGYPFVKGKLSDGTSIHAPLLFFPVTLKMDREQWCLQLREEGNVVLNQSFALAYAHFNETSLPDEILEKSFEDFPKDFLEFRTQLYEWLKTTPFRINFNQELFDEKLVAFSAEKASELDNTCRNGELKLYPEAVLGIFPQAGSYLVPDYNALITAFDEQPFSVPLINAEEEGYTEDQENNLSLAAQSNVSKVREEEILTPFPVDEAQEDIILQVKTGKSVVVQGPPGSGKSQLICNLMSDFASRGKRVLLVCQKRAALDVVHQRLKTIGMDRFVALIHDFKNDRAALYRQIAAQIEDVDAYRKENYSLDAVFLERQFTQESRAIDKTVADLNAFREALFDETECGVSIKELYLTSDQRAPHTDLLAHYRHFRIDQWDDFRRRLKTYFDYTIHITAAHDWAERRDFAGFGLAELRRMEQMLDEIPAVFLRQKDKFQQLTSAHFSIDFCQNRTEALGRLRDITALIHNNESWSLLKQYLSSAHNAHERLAFVRQTADALDGFLQEEGIEFSLNKTELVTFSQSLNKALESKGSALTGFFWGIFSKEKKEIERVATANGLSLEIADLRKLQVQIRNRQEVEGWLSQASLHYKESSDTRMQPDIALTQFFRNAESAADAVVRCSFQPWQAVLHAIITNVNDKSEFDAILKGLIQWLETWDKMEREMLPFLLPSQIGKLISEPAYAIRLRASLTRDFDSLVDMDRLFKEMTSSEQSVAKSVRVESSKSGLANTEAMMGLFENSIKLAWIEHIESKYPQLRAVTSLKMAQWEDQLQASIQRKQKLSVAINSIKLREGTYEDIAKNRLGNTVTYRELAHQVTKKRKIWPIRKVLESYSEEVFSLVPCWLASPESVSAIFPMQQALFDLVIFDEASQCYAEYGLPAAFRGKQLVVTGDDKQLSPSDLYKVRYEDRGEEDDEYVAAREIESLLDLAAQSLEQYQLTGHYRSQSLDLIDFSNRQFYKNSLRLLPDFSHINAGRAGIQYIKTEGIWKQNTNAVEVERVVELVKELIPEGKSIGIVTFNFYQQAAIQDSLEKESMLPPDLFVKNIENVQGDERDIIIFSMGYAPDERGRLSMQFGSLNMQGGENRLNVAVTRARERIYFVTSLWPAQMQTDHTANAGPKMLKAYLEYALEVSQGKFQPVPVSAKQFRTDWLLKERLTRLRPDYRKELPFGDVTIKEEGVYKGLILTDDDLYHESKSSKEPHAYLPLLLRQKNWPFRRIYSREYWSGNLPADIL